jgi:hypothetical protein
VLALAAEAALDVPLEFQERFPSQWRTQIMLFGIKAGAVALPQ